MPIRTPCSTAALVAIACFLATLGVTSHARAQAKPLPEEMFFPDRPDGLKALQGKEPPKLKLKSWIGDPVSVPDSKGKVVVIDFWATWCGPCMAAIPENVEIVKKYKDKGLVFMGVHDANSGWDKAPDVVRDKQINYPVAVDEPGGVSAKSFQLAFWPTYIVIDRAGTVRGAGLNPKKLEEAVKMLLAEPAPPGLGGTTPESGPPSGWFYGGAARPAALKALEGKPMPAISAAQWLDTPLTAADTKDRVVVVHFFSSGNSISMKHADALAALEKEMGPQGVVFVAVAADGDDWDQLRKVAAEKHLPTRLCQDAAAEKPGTASGATAAAFGVRYAPCTVVVDRSGVVRAAGARVDMVKEIAGKLLAESAKPAPQAPGAK